jgi:hypothetical protein
LAKGLSISFIFSKNQPFVLLILCTVFLFSISLISAVIFIISFHLLIFLKCILFKKLFIYFCGTGGWTQGFMLARKVLLQHFEPLHQLKIYFKLKIVTCSKNFTVWIKKYFLVLFESGSYCVAQAALGLQSFCFCLLSAGITGVYHHTCLHSLCFFDCILIAYFTCFFVLPVNW